MKKITEKTMLSAALKVVKAFRRIGENKINMEFNDKEVLIYCPLSEDIDWQILEEMKSITDNPVITWGLKKNCSDSLAIYLKNEL